METRERATIVEKINVHRILFSLTEQAGRYDDFHLTFKLSGSDGL